jgi:hypothetical protein
VLDYCVILCKGRFSMVPWHILFKDSLLLVRWSFRLSILSDTGLSSLFIGLFEDGGSDECFCFFVWCGSSPFSRVNDWIGVWQLGICVMVRLLHLSFTFLCPYISNQLSFNHPWFHSNLLLLTSIPNPHSTDVLLSILDTSTMSNHHFLSKFHCVLSLIHFEQC